MRYVIVAFIFINLNISYNAYGANKINLNQSTYFGSDDFTTYGAGIAHIKDEHAFSLNYMLFNNMDSKYVSLHKAFTGYLYTGKKFHVGLMVGSSSNKLFKSKDETAGIAFAGYNIFDPRSNVALYLGAVVSSEKNETYESHVMPYINFIYKSEYWDLHLGLPRSHIVIKPHVFHEFDFLFSTSSINKELSASYKFKPSVKCSFRTGYEMKEESFSIHARDSKNYKLIYHREWLFLEHEYACSRNVKAKVKYAYQLNGYKDYGKSYKRSRADKLDDVQMLNLSMIINF